MIPDYEDVLSTIDVGQIVTIRAEDVPVGPEMQDDLPT